MLKADVARSIERVASVHGIDPAALKAVVEVESNGVVFADIDGKEMPVIRFEGHYFDRLVTASRREEARRLGLASPTVGGVTNPASQKARWQLLGRAMMIDKQAALEARPSALGRSWAATGRLLAIRLSSPCSKRLAAVYPRASAADCRCSRR